MSVRIDEQGLWLGDNVQPLISGSVQYWRAEPEHWPRILDQVCEMGLKIIESYAPWSVHELSRGHYDFSGAKDLGRFLDLAHARGLSVWLRPGPHINAELTGFGYPERILADSEIQARGPEGHPIWIPAPPRMFPAPSLAAEKLYTEFRLYLEALAEILWPRQYPAGPLVLLQADNETHFFFRSGVFDQDYSEAALAGYRLFLRRKHGGLAEIERAHGQAYGAFDTLRPPTSFRVEKMHELPRYLDWAAFREHLLRGSVFRVAAMMREAGLRLPLTHNLPPGAPRSPLDLGSLEKDLDLVGMDFYYNRHQHRAFKARCLDLVGRSRYPTAPEFASGGQLAWPPSAIDDQVFLSLGALMHGVRGFNFYMLVERDRWSGAPILRDGKVDPERRDWLRRWLRIRLGLCEQSSQHDVVLLSTPLAERIEALSQALDPLPSGILSLLGAGAGSDCLAWMADGDHAPAKDFVQARERFFDALCLARLSFLQSDIVRGLDSSRFRVACLPGAEIMERDTALALLAYVRAGGWLVLGPRLSRRDSAGQRMTVLAEAFQQPETWGRGQMRHWPDLLETPKLAERLSALGKEAGCLSLPDPHCPELETALCSGREGKCLWLANPGDQPRGAVLDVSGAAVALDLWQQRVLRIKEGRLRIEVPAWSVRLIRLGDAP